MLPYLSQTVTAHHLALTLQLPLLSLLIIVICLFYIHDEKNLSNSILVKVLAEPSGREHSWGLRETMSSYVFMFGGLEAASIIGIFVTESN